MPHPAMPVASTQTRRLDLQNNTTDAGNGIRQFPNSQRPSEYFVDNRFHLLHSVRVDSTESTGEPIGLPGTGTIF